MNGKVKRDSFRLLKLKLMKSGGVESTTSLAMFVDGSEIHVKRNEETPVVPHPDLEKTLKILKSKLISSCRLDEARKVVSAKDFKATAAQKEYLERWYAELAEKTHVIGVHVSGEEQTEGAIITGKIQAENGSNIAINSPRIRFTSQTYGWEEELRGEVLALEDELYYYLYDGKKEQLEMFDGE